MAPWRPSRSALAIAVCIYFTIQRFITRRFARVFSESFATERCVLHFNSQRLCHSRRARENSRGISCLSVILLNCASENMVTLQGSRSLFVMSNCFVSFLVAYSLCLSSSVVETSSLHHRQSKLLFAFLVCLIHGISSHGHQASYL